MITVIIFSLLCCFFPFGFVPVAFGVSPSVIFGGLLYPTSFQIHFFLTLNLFSIFLTFTPRPSLHSIFCEDEGQVIAHPVLLRCASLQSLKASLVMFPARLRLTKRLLFFGDLDLGPGVLFWHIFTSKTITPHPRPWTMRRSPTRPLGPGLGLSSAGCGVDPLLL